MYDTRAIDCADVLWSRESFPENQPGVELLRSIAIDARLTRLEGRELDEYIQSSLRFIGWRDPVVEQISPDERPVPGLDPRYPYQTIVLHRLCRMSSDFANHCCPRTSELTKKCIPLQRDPNYKSKMRAKDTSPPTERTVQKTLHQLVAAGYLIVDPWNPPVAKKRGTSWICPSLIGERREPRSRFRSTGIDAESLDGWCVGAAKHLRQEPLLDVIEAIIRKTDQLVDWLHAPLVHERARDERTFFGADIPFVDSQPFVH